MNGAMLNLFTDAVNLTYILAGVLGGVALVIIITIAIFAYHRWRSSASGEYEKNSCKLENRKS